MPAPASYDAQITIRAGEKDIVYGSFTALASGATATVAGAIFTLYDSQGNVVQGFSGVGASLSPSNLGTVAAAAGDVYYLLDTTSLIPGSTYYGVFYYQLTGNDTLVRNEKPDVQIYVRPLVEIPFSNSGDIGRVRRWLRDTDPTSPVHSDPDIQQYLIDANDGITLPTSPADQWLIYQAAAYGWLAVSSTKALQAKIQKISIFQTDKTPLYKAALVIYKEFQSLSNQVYGSATVDTTGSYDPVAAYLNGQLKEW